ncbi:TetR/AcrR family transcriptional regulator [Streptomyces sp. P6-2-1]|uniref:TetR/AcrR family transcriptional regulator n=1 Tax=Streptomyces sp. P6-2-1 TaxID=3422591 RepID=UPI003D36C12A
MPLRADARENRRRILDVARVLFAERGIDVPLKVVARRAGVAPATLFRRFPTRQDLLAEVFADQFARCAALVETALAEPDPWTGLSTAVHGLAELQAADHGFGAAFVSELPDAGTVEAKFRQGMEGFGELLRRAKAAGQVREEVVLADLALALLANSGVLAVGGEAASPASRRLTALLLDSFRPRPGAPGPPLPPPAPLSIPRVVFPAGGDG